MDQAHTPRDVAATQRPAVFRFQGFELRPGRELLRDGAPLVLGKPALALLGALVGARGHLVTKDELFDAAWPGVVVVENALHQHVRALRKALGDRSDLVGTVARRGYRFMGEVEEITGDARDAATQLGESAAIPLPLTPLVGREDELAAVEALLLTHRCLSLLGPGGVGKTRLALELARRQADRGPARVCWVELAGIAEGDSVAGALATAFGLSGPSSLAPLLRIRHALRDTAAWLVLDNCEHLIEACAAAVHELLGHCPLLRILATSQRPLGLSGEQRFRVAMLGLPPAGASEPAVLAQSPAVRLLLARAQECNPQWLVDADADANALQEAAELCRHLEGLPLAIELAAMRVASLGLAATRTALVHHFQLLAGARRDGLPKHQSLNAMIDWSHGLLPAEQQRLFRRLSVFAGGWTMASACAVIGQDTPDSVDSGARSASADVAAGLADLVDRSLIAGEATLHAPRLRMLEAQRVYAADQLRASGERAHYAAAHARHVCDLFEASYADWDTTADSAWIACYGSERDNLRAALRFALETADVTLAARLAGASIWLWRASGAIHELQQMLDHALLQSGVGLPDAVQARLLLARAYSLHATSTESLRVRLAAQRAVGAFEGSGDWLGATNALLCLASADAQFGDSAAHQATLGRVDALLGARRHGKAYAWYCGSHAWAAQLAGDLGQALGWAIRSRAAYRGSGAWHGETRAMLHIADLRLAMDDVDGAMTIGAESVARLEGRQHRGDHGRALANLGAAWLARGDLVAARDCWSRALHELRGLDFSYWVFDHLALLALAQGRDDCAARLVGYADAGYARLGKGKRVQNEQRAHARAMAHLSLHYDAGRLAALLSAGASASEDEVITLALMAQPLEGC